MSAFSRLSAMMTFQKPAERPEVAAANKERTRELERLKAFKVYAHRCQAILLLFSVVQREGEDQLVSRYLTLLSRRTLDLVELRREVADNFVPDSVRDLVWKLLCGYMPADAASRDTFISTVFFFPPFLVFCLEDSCISLDRPAHRDLGRTSTRGVCTHEG